MSRDDDLIYEIRTHLVYELKWLIYAAARFEEGRDDDPYVDLIDSAAIHARNLFEFAAKKDPRRFTPHAFGGHAAPSKPWDLWANNRVTHMLEREKTKAPWPKELDNDRSDRHTVMAGAVLERLADGESTMPSGPVRDWYLKVIGAARAYWADASEPNHQNLAELYDDSRDAQAGSE